MGILLLIVGLGAVGFGVFNLMAARRVLSAPFKKTGELAKSPVSDDPRGAMSTEGAVVPSATPLLSPASRQPCLAYELKIERLFEKTETTQDGTKTVKGTETLDTIRGGTVFGLDDGSGVFSVDVSKGADFDNFKEGLKKELNGHPGSSHVMFGEYRYDVPVLGSGKGQTTGFRATERYVPAEGRLFVLGQLEGQQLVKPGWRSMMASSRGREGMLGSLEKRKKFSFIGGGIASVLSVPLIIMAPAADPSAEGASCPSTITDARKRCHDSVDSADSFTWHVTKAGRFEVMVHVPKKKVAFDPGLKVTDGAGAVVADVSGGVGQDAMATVEVQPGTYTVKVFPADHFKVKGGYSYELEIAARGEVDGAPKPAVKKQK